MKSLAREGFPDLNEGSYTVMISLLVLLFDQTR